MSRIVWDEVGERFYETGVRNTVLYLQSTAQATKGQYLGGVAWNGVTAITEKPTGAEATALYADDVKYLNLVAAEEFEASVEAYTYPDEFGVCDGSASIATGVQIGQQDRAMFGLCYRTTLGDDVAGNGYAYKLHFIYGAVAAPSEKAYATINDSPEAITFSWELKSTPVPVANRKPTASLVIDSSKADHDKLMVLEAILYGADEFSATNAYAKGDVVAHGEGQTAKLYQANDAVAAGEWDASDWTEVGTPAEPRMPLPNEVAQIMTVVA